MDEREALEIAQGINTVVNEVGEYIANKKATGESIIVLHHKNGKICQISTRLDHKNRVNFKRARKVDSP